VRDGEKILIDEKLSGIRESGNESDGARIIEQKRCREQEEKFSRVRKHLRERKRNIGDHEDVQFDPQPVSVVPVTWSAAGGPVAPIRDVAID